MATKADKLQGFFQLHGLKKATARLLVALLLKAQQDCIVNSIMEVALEDAIQDILNQIGD